MAGSVHQTFLHQIYTVKTSADNLRVNIRPTKKEMVQTADYFQLHL